MQTMAIEYYKGGKGNCAQAVAAAWAEKTGSGAEMVEELVSCGRGDAPGGLCGALYGALYAAGRVRSEAEAAPIREAFLEKTGGLCTCRDIRSARALPCVECVRLAACLLEPLSKN